MKKKFNRGLALLLAAVMVIMIAPTLASPAAKQTFSDVPTNHWAYEYIERTFAEKAIEGTSYNEATGDRKFSPENTMTVAQFLTIMGRKCYPDEYAKKITEAPKGAAWYWPAAQLFTEKGMVGNSIQEDVLFVWANMNDKITRAKMAEVMIDILADLGYELPEEKEYHTVFNKIADIEQIGAAYWMDTQNKILITYYLGLISGMDSKGTFAGGKTMTRAQGATVFCRLSDYMTSHEAGVAEYDKNYAYPGGFNPADPGQPESGNSEEIKDIYDPEYYVKNLTQEEIDEILEEELELLNNERTKRGLNPLKANPKLYEAAAIRAEEIDRSYSHTRPDGRICSTVLSEVGISASTNAENIAMGEDTPEEVIDDWMNSPKGHREIILSSKYTDVGLGLFVGKNSIGNYSYRWVQIFIKNNADTNLYNINENQNQGGNYNPVQEKDVSVKLTPKTDYFDSYTVSGQTLEGYKTVKVGGKVYLGNFTNTQYGKDFSGTVGSTDECSNPNVINITSAGVGKALTSGECIITTNYLLSGYGNGEFTDDSITKVILHVTVVE